MNWIFLVGGGMFSVKHDIQHITQTSVIFCPQFLKIATLLPYNFVSTK